MITQVRERGLVLPKTIVRVEKQMYPPLANSVLYFPGYPPLGNTITDFSGSANHGTIYGATWTRLPSGLPVLSFDGTDDYVDCGIVNEATHTTFSIKIWLKRITDTGGYESLFWKGAADGSDWDYFLRYSIGVDFVAFTFKDAAGVERSTNSTNLTTGVWFQLVITWDGTYIRMYENATLIKTSADFSATPPRFTADYVFRICRAFASNEGFTGLGALPTLNTTTLSAPTIANIYNRERHLFNV